MKNSLKLPIMAASSIILLAGSFFSVPAAHAAPVQKPIPISAQDAPQPRIGQVAIFFGGIVVAWIADASIRAFLFLLDIK